MLINALSDVWNDALVSWTGIGLDITPTAYALTSRIIDLKLGGTTRFAVGPLGQGYFSTSLGVGTLTPVTELQVAGSATIDNVLHVFDSDFSLTVGGGNPIINFDSSDYILFERAVDTLSIIVGGGPVATFSPAVGVSIQTTAGQRLLEVGAADSSRPGYRSVEVIN